MQPFKNINLLTSLLSLSEDEEEDDDDDDDEDDDDEEDELHFCVRQLTELLHNTETNM